MSPSESTIQTFNTVFSWHVINYADLDAGNFGRDNRL